MKLSIITICYNEKDIEKTCQSIASQTWQDFEWIVIDGGSEKWCTSILEKYKSKMAYYISEKDKGIYNAMNKGILQAKGEYLSFMNAGDCYHDEMVLFDVFNNNSFSDDIIYGKECRLLKDGTSFVIGKKNDFKSALSWQYKYYLLRHQASFIKRELFDKFGLYDLQYKSASDFEMFFRVLYINNGSSVFYNRVISIFKVFDGMSSETGNIGKEECMHILKIHNIYLESIWQEIKHCNLSSFYQYILKRFLFTKLAQITPYRPLRRKIRNLWKK